MSGAAVHTLVKPPRYFTPGVWVIAAVAAVGGLCWLYRMTFGLGAATHLSAAYPWGIWIGIDVACGVALAAGGFTSAFLAHLLHREAYHAVVRPALLTAAIGYTFVALGVMTDLGRYWAMWHVMMPSMWQPNSVLFEVAICVMCYLTVLYIEFAPIVFERFIGRVSLPGLLGRLNGPVDGVLRFLDTVLGKVMTVFVVLGVLLSCMHQSSLGTLMVISGTKLHPLWQSPFLPLMFLLSAFAVGYPMVIFESVIAHRSLGLKVETKVLSLLARYTPIILTLYLGVKVFDLFRRGVAGEVLAGTFASNLFIAEVTIGAILPILIFAIPRFRRSVAGLFIGACLVILGLVMNRLDVFLIAYSPLDQAAHYTPSFMEIAVTAGFIATMVLIYRFVVLNFPVIEELDVPGRAAAREHAHAAGEPRARELDASPDGELEQIRVLRGRGLGAIAQGVK
ncbi:MAG: Ni/Fe-hydrogenase cytochrome b subunit [Phycisphaeraceae bacterium]|nr:MAG: Ni/Fe-hydrogenase cytochrome b subunit [Phycisphaeraceae bacterium]